MPKALKFVLLLIVAIFIVVFFVYRGVNRNLSNPQSSTSPQSEQQTLSLQTNSEGGVEVTVTPRDITSDSPSFIFEISLNTHAGSLSQDLVAVSELHDERNNVYKPLQWVGSEPGGHHRSGTLKFAQISPLPKSITLIIKDVGGVAQRVFQWTLN